MEINLNLDKQNKPEMLLLELLLEEELPIAIKKIDHLSNELFFCTNNHTYKARQLILSNNYLPLVENQQSLELDNGKSKYYTKQLSSYLKLTLTIPPFNNIYKKLQQAYFYGPTHKETKSSYTEKEFLNWIPVSLSEIKNVYSYFYIISFNDHIYIPHPDYTTLFVKMILALLDALQMDFTFHKIKNYLDSENI